MPQYTVNIQGLELYGFNGVSPEERAIGHRIQIDLSLEVEGDAPLSDDVHHTVDYGAVCSATQDFLQSTSCQTLERLAHLLGKHLLERFPSASSIDILLAKPHPPTAQIVKSAGVGIKIDRN